MPKATVLAAPSHRGTALEMEEQGWQASLLKRCCVLQQAAVWVA